MKKWTRGMASEKEKEGRRVTTYMLGKERRSSSGGRMYRRLRSIFEARSAAASCHPLIIQKRPTRDTRLRYTGFHVRRTATDGPWPRAGPYTLPFPLTRGDRTCLVPRIHILYTPHARLYIYTWAGTRVSYGAFLSATMSDDDGGGGGGG